MAPRNSCRIMARRSLMILSLRHTTNIGCEPPTSVVQRECRFCAPEEADVCSLGALTVRRLCNIAHSQDHPSMPFALDSRTMGAHGDSEAVAATVLTAVSLVPRQVVFVERVDGFGCGCVNRPEDAKFCTANPYAAADLAAAAAIIEQSELNEPPLAAERFCHEGQGWFRGRRAAQRACRGRG
jgi:hypothetical protein